MASYADSDRLLTVQGLITYPDTVTQAITSTHISSFNIVEDAGRDVPIGAAPASHFLLKLDNSSGQWEPGGSLLGAHSLDGAKIEIEIGLWNGSAYDYSKIGTYYVEDVRGQEHETTITLSGSDAMISKMSAYFADAPGDYPRTIGALLVDVAAEAGVTLESSTFTNSNVSITAQPNWRNDLTCRDVVGYIAACAGGIAKFNRDGKLDITTLERAASRAISTSVYKRLTRENTTFGALNAINIYAHGAPENTAPVRFATTPATPDTSLNSINIKGNPILANGSSTTSSVGTGMLTALSGMSFRGATFDWHGDPSLVLGKICSVTDLSSNSVSVLITKQTIKFDAGFEMTSGCDVTTSTKADASNKLQKIFTPTGNLNAEALAGNIYVKAGEKMTLESGSNLNLLSGGAINIKNLSGTDNVINMDNTGLTLSSTGQLKLQSADSIIIGGSPFGVGGTNLIKNSHFSKGSTGWLAANASVTDLSGVVRVTFAGGAGSGGISSTNRIRLSDLVVGQVYTLTIRAQATSSTNVSVRIPGAASPPNIGAFPWGFQTKSIQFTAETTANTDEIYIFKYNEPAGSILDIAWIKLEKGPVATDWSPAPQDTVDALDALDGRLGDVETRVQVFYQTSKPTYTAVGDIWYDTDSNPLEVWKCTNVSTQAHSAFTDPVLTRALSAQTTANSKITTFVGDTTPTALAAGDLWMDTGNKNIWKRATAAGTGGWVQYLTAAGYLITTGVTIDGTDLTVKATGNLNLAADGNLNIQNGGNLNVLNGGDIEINNGGDINVASGGKINVSATDLIISGKTVETYASDKIRLEVQVGGTNLLRNSDWKRGANEEWNIAGAPAALDSLPSRYFDGKPALYLGRNAGAPYGMAEQIVPNKTILPNQPYTFSVYYYGTGNNYVTRPIFYVSLYKDGVFTQQFNFMASSGTNTSNIFYWPSDLPRESNWKRLVMTFTPTLPADEFNVLLFSEVNAELFSSAQLERGNKVTPWAPAEEDPASGVKTSFIDIATDHIDIATGGNLSLTGGNFNLTGGSGTKAIGMSTNRADEYMMWAGNATPASAPFSVKRDGSVKATSGVIGGFTLGTSKLYNGKSTLTSTTAGVYVGTDGISLGSAGVAPQFKVTSAGSLYSSSGTIGGFTIESGSLSAQASGKPLLKLDTANSTFQLANMTLLYNSDPSYPPYQFIVDDAGELLFGTPELIVADAFDFFTASAAGVWVYNNVSALSFTDRTPFYDGDAVKELKKIKGNGKGIDHDTLPEFARANIKRTKRNKDGTKEEIVEDGRDLGAMISILTKAVQELDGRLEKIEDRIK